MASHCNNPGVPAAAAAVDDDDDDDDIMTPRHLT